MSLVDLQAFLQERIQSYDETIDVGSGSDADSKIIQPTLRRLGPDPFSVDVRAFIMDRLNQEFPDFATNDGDALTDLLVKPGELLLDPVVRENSRVRNNLSFRDPTTLTLDEADSLGANFFVSRETGDYSGGSVRIYFSAPQSQSVNPSNYVTSRSGLSFFPTSVQSISVNEMLFNVEGNNYYFDVTVAAETAGDQYNIDAGEIVSIAGVNSAAKVTNKVRFTGGIQAEDAPTYIGRVQQSITERSLVTKRGIVTQLSQNFPEMTRLNVVGFNDPEMERDIIEGNGIGPIIAAGLYGYAMPDGNNSALTSWFSFSQSTTLAGTFSVQNGLTAVTASTSQTDVLIPGSTVTFASQPSVSYVIQSVAGTAIVLATAYLGTTNAATTATLLEDADYDFTQLIGPTGEAVVGWTLTLHGYFLGAPPVKDIPVSAVISPTVLELDSEIVPLGLSKLTWELRQSVLTLSSIPGGILFPNGPNGTVTVPDDEVHIGGCTDIYLRGTVLDTDSMTITVLSDDEPLLSGFQATAPSSGYGTGGIVLYDLVLGSNYNFGDSTYLALFNAYSRVDQLQILAGVGAGIYRVLSVSQGAGLAPVLTVTPTPVPFSKVRWRLVDEINVDLLAPKETFITGDDLQTIATQAVVTTASAVDFLNFGVASGYMLNIEDGPDEGEYTILAVTPFPNYTQLQLNRAPQFTKSNLQYTIFRSSGSEALSQPMIRIDTIALLDQNSQPTGTNIPYALPIGAFSDTLSHPGNGIKFDIEDAVMGIIGINLGSPPQANVVGLTLILDLPGVALAEQSITFTGSNPLPLNGAGGIIDQINAAYNAAGYPGIVAIDGGECLAILGNIGALGAVVIGAAGASSAIPPLFGYINGTDIPYIHSFMVRAPEFTDNNNYFTQLSPPFDDEYDVLQTLDGAQIGFFEVSYLYPFPGSAPSIPAGLTHPNAMVLTTSLIPQTARHIQFGARSIGTARLYFLEPTTIQVNSQSSAAGQVGNPTIFTATLSTGAVLNFFGDPAEQAQILPALPGGTQPMDGVAIASSSNYTSASQDFVATDVQAGDELVVTYIPITGSAPLADPVVNLAFTTFIFSIGGSPDITLTFNRDNLALSPNDVSRQGVADEINSTAGVNIASIIVVAGSSYLQIVSTAAFTIRKTGTSNTLLGFSTVADTNNAALNSDTYVIASVIDSNTLQVQTFLPFNETNEQFSIVRPGVQRVGTTTMNSNVGPTGLYYADIEIVSQGTGNLYDLAEDTLLVVTEIQADGYYLTCSDPNLTFSPAEDIELHISKTINEVGTSDSLANATPLLGQSIQVNYEYSSLTSQINNFVLSDQERVINDSPLARHLLPNFVRFDLYYSGGPTPSNIQPTIETLIQALFPDQQLQVSDIQAILTRTGATSITNPLTLFGVIYNLDRSIGMEMSQDRLNTTGRLAAFIPDVINLLQSLT